MDGKLVSEWVVRLVACSVELLAAQSVQTTAERWAAMWDEKMAAKMVDHLAG